MTRELTEIHRFTKDDLARIAMSIARMKIIGDLYIGEFGDQVVDWLPDGTAIVSTTHSPARAEMPVAVRIRTP